MTMTASEAANKATIRRVFDEFVNRGDFSVVDEIYRPDMIDHQPLPGAPEGTDGVRYTIAGLRSGFPDLHVTIEDMSAHGDHVVVHNTWRGTHLGDFLGLAPTGKPVEFTGVVVWRLAGGLIAERWGIGVESTLVADFGMPRMLQSARPGRYRRADAETVLQALPLAPERMQDWRMLHGELAAGRRLEYDGSRRRLGIVRESFSLQQAGDDPVVVHLLEARSPRAAARRAATSADGFDSWLRETARALHGFDPWAAIAAGDGGEQGADWKVAVDLSAAVSAAGGGAARA